MRLLPVLILVVASLAGCSSGDDDEAPDEVLPPPAAGKGLMRGVVTDTSIVPLEGVSVVLRSTGEEQVTDGDGAFRFLDVDPGTHFLDVDKVGYEGVQVSAQVEAGVKAPAVITVQLAPAPGQLPYAVPSKHTGFVACETLVAYYLQPCDLGTGAFGEPDSQIFLGADDRAPDAVQVEVLWEHNQDFGARMTMTIGSCDGGEYCSPFQDNMLCQNWGPSPLWCRVTQDDSVASGYHNTYQSLNETGHGRNQQGVGVGLHLGADCSVCGDPVDPAAGVGLIIQQEINTFLWSFYNFEPDEDWLFVQNGAPEP